MAETRKLAAILAADVAGYSRLAGADEERTLARLRALRSDLIDPTIAVHNGRVVKRTGDGSIVEFRSVVDAVRCTIEMQNGMVERNTGLPPERRIEFRVGIHKRACRKNERSAISAGKFVEQRISLFQIERIEALREPAIDRGEKIAGLLPLALIAPEPRHAHCRAQFP